VLVISLEILFSTQTRNASQLSTSQFAEARRIVLASFLANFDEEAESSGHKQVVDAVRYSIIPTEI